MNEYEIANGIIYGMIIILLVAWLWKKADTPDRNARKKHYREQLQGTGNRYKRFILRELREDVQPSDKVYSPAEKEMEYNRTEELSEALAYLSFEAKELLMSVALYSSDYQALQDKTHLLMEHIVYYLSGLFKQLQTVCSSEKANILVLEYEKITELFAKASWEVVMLLAELKNNSDEQELEAILEELESVIYYMFKASCLDGVASMMDIAHS